MDNLKNKIQEQMHQMNVDEPSPSTWNDIKSHLEGGTESDLLKKHIAQNRNGLEIEMPAEVVWGNIKKNRAEKPVFVLHIKKRMLYLSAACIVIIAVVGIIRYIYMSNSAPNYEVVQKDPFKKAKANDTTELTNTADGLTIKQSLPEITKEVVKEKKLAIYSSISKKKQAKNLLPKDVRQVEKDYNELITAQIKYTRSLAIYGESAGYFEQFKNDFRLLEKQEKELRISIAQKGLQENSITDLAMIYQEKLTVLKKLQTEIKKTSTRNKNLTDTIPAYINL